MPAENRMFTQTGVLWNVYCWTWFNLRDTAHCCQLQEATSLLEPGCLLAGPRSTQRMFELWIMDFWLLAGWQANWWDDSQDKLDLFHWWVKLEWHIFWTNSYPEAWMRSWIWPVGCQLSAAAAGDHSPVHRAGKEPIHIRRRYPQCGLFKYNAHGWYFILALFLYFLLENVKKKKECSCFLCAFFSIKQ